MAKETKGTWTSFVAVGVVFLIFAGILGVSGYYNYKAYNDDEPPSDSLLYIAYDKMVRGTTDLKDGVPTYNPGAIFVLYPAVLLGIAAVGLSLGSGCGKKIGLAAGALAVVTLLLLLYFRYALEVPYGDEKQDLRWVPHAPFSGVGEKLLDYEMIFVLVDAIAILLFGITLASSGGKLGRGFHKAAGVFVLLYALVYLAIFLFNYVLIDWAAPTQSYLDNYSLLHAIAGLVGGLGFLLGAVSAFMLPKQTHAKAKGPMDVPAGMRGGLMPPQAYAPSTYAPAAPAAGYPPAQPQSAAPSEYGVFGEYGVSESPGTACPVCGADLPPNSAYCPYCGYKA